MLKGCRGRGPAEVRVSVAKSAEESKALNWVFWAEGLLFKYTVCPKLDPEKFSEPSPCPIRLKLPAY
jgi:hypothetical protein